MNRNTTRRLTAPLTAVLAVGTLALSMGMTHADPKMSGPKMGGMKMGHSKMSGMDMSRYGGPVYTGAPALNVTSALVAAGGGADNYSTATALTAMVGAPTVTAEVGKLTKQYGKAKVSSWLTVFDFAVKDALAKATAAGVTLPAADPALSGKKLATTLVTAGLDKNGTFYTEYLLDKAVTHKIHSAVMDDIDAKFGAPADTDYHRITNQAMVDVAHALGAKSVKVAKLH